MPASQGGVPVGGPSTRGSRWTGGTADGSRGRGFAQVFLVSVASTSAVLGCAGYFAFAAIDLASAGSFGLALGMFGLAGLASMAAAVVVPLSVIAVIRCRPPGTSALAAVLSLGLPVLAVVLAVLFGVWVSGANLSENGGTVDGPAGSVIDPLGDRGAPVDPPIEIAENT